MLFALILYSGSLLPLTQASVAESPKNAKGTPPPCTVSGQVVSAADATPLRSVRVVLVSEQRQERTTLQTFSATSDGEGRFTFKSIPPGRYQFFASHAGYVKEAYQSNGSEKGALLSLRAGQEIREVLFRMTRAAVVTGRVTDEDGEPMENIQVVALRRPTEDEIEQYWWLRQKQLTPAAAVQTDDRGEFRLFDLKPGEYFVRAEDQFFPSNSVDFSNDWTIRESMGSQYAPVFYPGVTQLSQAQAVAATAGAEIEADFILRHTKMVEVSGKVVGIDGKPPVNAYVMLREFQSPDFFGHGAEVDKNGEFKLRGVPPGSYVLMAQQQSNSENGAGYQAQQKIELGEDNVDSITLVLGRGTKIFGHILTSGSMLPEALSLSLEPRDADLFGGWARVKKDGSFEILDVADGSFTLDIGGLGEGYYVQSARAGRDDILTNGLQVDKEKGLGTIQIVIAKATAQLQGSVLQDGAPLVGARVRITPVPETAYNRMSAHTTSTDQTGRFTFPAIGPGKYKVEAKTSTQDGRKPAASEPLTVTLSENEHKEVNLTVLSPDTP